MPPLSPPLVFVPPPRYRHPPQGGDTPWLRITDLEYVEWTAYPATNANARRVVSSTSGRGFELSNSDKKSSNGVISTGSSS